MKSILTTRIEEAKAQGKTALIPFLPAGFPSEERFWAELEALDKSGASVIEIGMPFSDPVADGPAVERASQQSLERGINLDWILSGLKERKGQFNAGLLLMGYLNPILVRGVAKFMREAGEAGVAGLIIADLPYEEQADIRAEAEKNGIALIPLVGLNTTPERMALYAKDAKGFVYLVSVLGTTGARESLPEEVVACLQQAKEAFAIPVALGFGLKHPSQLESMQGLVDAAVFGSALINHIDAGGTSEEFMARWK